LPGIAKQSRKESRAVTDSVIARTEVDCSGREERFVVGKFELVDRGARTRCGLMAIESFADDRLDRHAGDEGTVIAFSEEVPRALQCPFVLIDASYRYEHSPSVFSPT